MRRYEIVFSVKNKEGFICLMEVVRNGYVGIVDWLLEEFDIDLIIVSN